MELCTRQINFVESTKKFHSNTKASNTQQSTTYYKSQWIALPAYNYYVEGDNPATPVKFEEPISKNLLRGIAEHIIWPPTRFGRIQRQIPSTASNNNTIRRNIILIIIRICYY